MRNLGPPTLNARMFRLQYVSPRGGEKVKSEKGAETWQTGRGALRRPTGRRQASCSSGAPSLVREASERDSWRSMLLEDYVDTIVQALGRVGRFEVEDQAIWNEVTGGRRRAEIRLARADIPRNRQTTLSIEVAWEPTHTFLYQLEELVEDHVDGARHAVYDALQGHERFCLDVIYTVELDPEISEEAVDQFLSLLDEKGVAGTTQVQLNGSVDESIRQRRPQSIRLYSHLHDTAYEHRISFGYFLDAIIGNLRHIDECRHLADV